VRVVCVFDRERETACFFFVFSKCLELIMLIIDIKEYSSKWKIENESSRAKFGWASGQ